MSARSVDCNPSLDWTTDTHPMRTRAFRFLHHNPVLQLLLVFAFWALGETLARTLKIPLPGAVLGLALLLALLATRQLSAVSMRRGAQWLLSDMLLFFVPAALAVLDHPEFLGWLGLKILVVILLSTLAVMLVTAFVVDRCYRWSSKDAVSPPVVDIENGKNVR